MVTLVFALSLARVQYKNLKCVPFADAAKEKCPGSSARKCENLCDSCTKGWGPCQTNSGSGGCQDYKVTMHTE